MNLEGVIFVAGWFFGFATGACVVYFGWLP